MIISPPFLLANAGFPESYDIECVNSVMQGGVVGSGGFPVSQGMAWHGGTHLAAPLSDSPVRAIADGTVIFRRDNTPLTHGGKEYSCGCVVIRHETEIGATPGANPTPTTLTYYSISQHLSRLDKDLPEVGKPVWRRMPLGLAGKIRGEDARIHFEIICGDDDLAALVGRRTGRLIPERDGRTDVLFGTIYVYVPRGADLYTSHPGANPPASASVTTEDLVFGIEHDKGAIRLRTWRLAGGEPVGLFEEKSFASKSDWKPEYGLYYEALDRHKHTPTGNSPSGIYELMRLGRKLGPDALAPDMPHWRRVQLPDGSERFINLNGKKTTKFSDADFPHWRGWRLVDDDVTDDDSRCDSAIIHRFLNTTPEGDPVEQDTPQTRKQRLCAPDVQRRLTRTVCKFPTEWSKEDVELRWRWTKERSPYNDRPVDEAGFQQMVAFAKQLCFWEDLPDSDRQRLGKKHWHWHPREFILHMRQCMWLSVCEMLQLLPSHAVRRGTYKDAQGVQHPAILWEGVLGPKPKPSDRTTVHKILSNHRIPLNQALRKWGINTPIRLVSFFGNSIQETTWWQSLSEGNGAALVYAPWYGRGFLQMTNPDNYIDYWRYRGRAFPVKLGPTLIDAAKKKKWGALQDTNFPEITQKIIQWRQEIAGDISIDVDEGNWAPSDSAGFYAAKQGLNFYADGVHIFERMVVPTVNSKGQSMGDKVYYRSQAFWKVSAGVNIPGEVNNTYSTILNGFESRCSGYGVALAVLTETHLPNANGHLSLDYPEGYVPRKNNA